MQPSFTVLTEAQAGELAGWRYDPPYDFNNFDSGDLGELLDRDSPYYAAVDAHGALIGFCCFGQMAQVPAGHAAGAYHGRQALDLGFGLRQDLTWGRPSWMPCWPSPGTSLPPSGSV